MLSRIVSQGFECKVWRHAVTLGFICLFYVSLNLVWIRLDLAPPLFDQGFYAHQSIRIYHSLSTGDLVQTWDSLKAASQPHPPVLASLGALSFLIFHPSYDAALVINIPLLVLLTVGIYLLCGQLTDKREVGLLAAWVVPAFPVVGALSRQFHIDFLLSALVVWSIYGLLKLYRFQGRYDLALVASLIVLGLLTKELYLVFVLPPLLWVLGALASGRLRSVGQRLESPTLRALITGALLILGTGFTLAVLWAIPWFRGALVEGFFTLVHSQRYLPSQWLGYWVDLIGWGTSFGLFAIGASVMIALLWQKGFSGEGYKWWIMGLWVFPSLLFLSVAENRDIRFCLSVLPAFGVMLSLGVFQIKSRVARWVATILIVLVSPFLFYAQAFGIDWLPEKIMVDIPGAKHVLLFDQGFEEENLYWHLTQWPQEKFLGQSPEWRVHTSYSLHPTRSQWPLGEMLTVILKDFRMSDPDAVPRVYIASSHPFFSPRAFECVRNFWGIPAWIWPYRRERTLEQKMEDVGRADYLITKGGPDWVGTYSFPYTEEVVSALKGGALPFEVHGERIPLPDGTTAIIWKRGR